MAVYFYAKKKSILVYNWFCYLWKEQNSKQTFKSFDLTIYFYEQTMQKQQALHFWNAGHEFNVWSVSQNWKKRRN